MNYRRSGTMNGKAEAKVDAKPLDQLFEVLGYISDSSVQESRREIMHMEDIFDRVTLSDILLNKLDELKNTR